MSKKVKNLITVELAGKFKPLDGVAVISPRGIDGIKTNQLRRRLRERGLRMTVVKNSLARRASTGTAVAGFEKLLEGPSAVIHGTASMPAVARMLLEEKKTNDKLELRGLFFDGEVFEGEKGIERASKLPTRQEAIASLVATLLGPGRKLAGALKGPGGKLGGVLKTIETNAKDKEGAAAPAV
jgi:large subunit ribosomal protein L10